MSSTTTCHRPPPRIFRIFLTKLCQWGQQVAIAFVEIPGALLDDQTKEILDNLFDNPMFRAVLSRAAETINSPSVNDPSVNLSDEILTLLNTQAFTDPNLISQDGGPSTAVTRAHLAALDDEQAMPPISATIVDQLEAQAVDNGSFDSSSTINYNKQEIYRDPPDGTDLDATIQAPPANWHTTFAMDLTNVVDGEPKASGAIDPLPHGVENIVASKQTPELEDRSVGEIKRETSKRAKKLTKNGCNCVSQFQDSLMSALWP